MSNEKRGVIYARYSAGPHQTEQSIEGQVRECKRYAEQNGITIIGEYIDRKISGTTDNREQFLRMIEDSRKHLFDVVITYKTDRFSRNRYDAAVYKRQLRLNGVDIAYSSESIPDGPEGIILESLLEGLAEYYSAELRQKIERGMHESALKCKAMGPSIMGYRKGADGRYEIVPEEAEVVRMVFEKYIAGEKLKDIAEIASTMGLRTRFGNPVSPTRLGDMVCNERYMGIYISHGVRVEGGMPAIVDQDTFYKAQQRKDYNRHRENRSMRAGRSFSKVDYLLSGKVFCGKCNSLMVGYGGTSHNGTVYPYYSCKGRIKKTCSQKNLPKDALEKLVARITIQYVLQPDVIAEIVAGCVQERIREDNTECRMRQLKQSLIQTEHEIDNIVTAIASGILSESLRDRLNQLERSKRRICLEMNQLRENPTLTAQQVRFMLANAGKKEGEDEFEYRKRLLNIFVYSVHIFDDRIVVTYNLTDSSQEKHFSVDYYKNIAQWIAKASAMLNCSGLKKVSPPKFNCGFNDNLYPPCYNTHNNRKGECIMAQITSAIAAKQLRKLNEQHDALLAMEKKAKNFTAAIQEDVESVRPAYDFQATQDALVEIEEKIRKLKHTLNCFNSTYVIPDFNMTIDQMLIYIPQLTARKKRLDGMRSKLPKERVQSNFGRGNNIIEYDYANYDIAKAEEAFNAVSDELAKAQNALDAANATVLFEADID